jgi:hypothetical protein
MILKIKNEYEMTENDVSQAFTINDEEVGMVSDVNQEEITVTIFDKYVTLQRFKSKKNKGVIINLIGFEIPIKEPEQPRSYRSSLDS